ncbi:MAG: fibronectin type III domain-containing protein [Saprospiraceae bacterium]|nr:fibronectin type III domain-containing protein [Saprospiraceae bacterium]
MKNLILTFILLWLSQQMVFGQCGPATNLSHQFNNGINTFSWDQVPDATQYELWVQDSGGYGWELLTTTTNNVFLTPGGVLSGSYEFYISVTCQNGDIHDSSVFPFTIPCPEPTNPLTTNISQTGATLQWTNFYQNDPIWPMGVMLAYRPLGSGSWISLNVNPYSSSYIMANLQPNTTYEWCINLDCPYFDSAPVISQFTTLQPACPSPLAPTLFAFTNNSLQVQWSSPWTASYLLEYKSVNVSTWTSITTNSNTMQTISGLDPGTSYHVRVARVCAANNTSLYSPVSTFTTNCVSLNNSAAYIRYFQLNGFLWTSGANPNGYFYGNSLIPVVLGNTYTLRLAGGGQINSGNKYNVAVYLDANQNYVYEPSERVFGVGFLSTTNLKNFTFTIPPTALTGTTRLRVVILKQNQGSITPCPLSGSLGDVEDYTLVVSPPASNKSYQITEDKIGQTQDTESAIVSTFEAKCKESVTVYTSPYDCTYDIKISDIDDGSYGYDSIYLTGSTIIRQPGIPFYVIMKVSKDDDIKRCVSKLMMRDTTPPVAISVDKMVVTFLNTDTIYFNKTGMDQGSYDQCTELQTSFEPAFARHSDPSPLFVHMMVTDTFGNRSSSLIEIEIVDKSSGFPADAEETKEVSDIQISPNPVADFCTLKGQNIHSVRIVDAVGKVISEQKNEATNPEILLDFSRVNAGMYFVEAYTIAGERRTTKVVKH